MKKYFVIGNPISHSLSPQLHNYWLKKNNIDGLYDKEKLSERDLEDFFLKIRDKKISGANITVPFKKEVISYLDDLSLEAKSTQSVNTVYLENDKIVGHNTDISGFQIAMKEIEYDLRGKKIFIIGAGGVVSSIVYALNKMKASNVILCNRTKRKAENLKDMFNNLTILDWGEIPDFDMVINATSLGLKSHDEINLDFSKTKKGKFFYDIIYNPEETNFLKKAKKLGCKTENGKKMFIYQAAESFKVWHGIKPQINDEIISLLDK
tara:strand:+ start:210 stop:1004 length:795 start_codon:yes stop_codon:yes gene_type:complete